MEDGEAMDVDDDCDMLDGMEEDENNLEDNEQESLDPVQSLSAFK